MAERVIKDPVRSSTFDDKYYSTSNLDIDDYRSGGRVLGGSGALSGSPVRSSPSAVGRSSGLNPGPVALVHDDQIWGLPTTQGELLHVSSTLEASPEETRDKRSWRRVPGT